MISEPKVEKQKVLSSWQIYLIIVTILIIIISAMIFSVFIGYSIAKKDIVLMHAADMILTDIYSAYISLDEHAYIEKYVTNNNILKKIEHASWCVNAMLEGEENENIKIIKLTDYKIRKDLEAVLENINKIKNIAEEWFHNVAIDKKDVSVELSKEFDIKFNSLSQKINKAKDEIQIYITNDLNKSIIIQLIIVFIIVLFVIFIATVLYIYDKQKTKNLITLQLANERVRLNENRLLITLKSIGDGVIATDKSGKILMLNKVAEELTGWTQEEAIGKQLTDVFVIVNELTREVCENPVQKVIENGVIFELTNHTILISKDGTERVLADIGAPIKDDDKIYGVIIVFRDITQKRKIDKQLQNMQKFEAIGLLAGGIAHDFNNILTAILGNANLVKSELTSDSYLFKIITGIEEITLRAKDLTGQLLTFAKGGDPVKKITSIKEIIKDSTTFVLRGSNTQCHFNFTENLNNVEIDPGQISQVIQNIVINSDQAMPEGGRIIINAENITIHSQADIPLHGEYIKLSIKDEGIGIPEKFISKVADPYFTTKKSGSGLGLSIVFSIIHKHDGYINISSIQGKGTIVAIYLPASNKEMISEKEECNQFISKLKSGGRILVMDDEEIIRKMLIKNLSRFGLEIEVAKNGEEAIEIFKTALKSKKPFVAVILDLTIPGGMGGKQVIKELQKIDPEVKAIASSGYSNDPVMSDFKEYGFSACIPKPYIIDDLVQLLKLFLN